MLNHPIKTIGLHTLPVLLHPEVEVKVIVNVARNADEAARLARGEEVRRPGDEDEDEVEVVETEVEDVAEVEGEATEA